MVGDSVQKMRLANNGEEIRMIEGQHHKHNGSAVWFGVGTWSGEWVEFGEKSDCGGGDKRVRYDGNVRGHKLAFLSSGKSENGVRVAFHWDKREE